MKMRKHMRASFPWRSGLFCWTDLDQTLLNVPERRTWPEAPQYRARAVWNLSVSQWQLRAGRICENPFWVFSNEWSSCLDFFFLWIQMLFNALESSWSQQWLRWKPYLERHLALHFRNCRVSSTQEFEMLPIQPQHLPLDANLHTYATPLINSRKTLSIKLLAF